MNAILTGASRGIGFQTALALCHLGIRNLVLVSRNKKNLGKLKSECETLNSSIRITVIAEDILTLIQDDNILPSKLPFDSIDILINNAGTLLNKPYQEIQLNEAFDIFNVNFHAPAQITRILTPLLQKSKSAHVVNIGSLGGYQGSSKFPGLSYYSSSKAALASLTECLAVEFSDSKIKFNCLALGAVQTEMLEEAFPGYFAPISSEEMGTYIADFAVNGNKYYNGQILPVRLSNP